MLSRDIYKSDYLYKYYPKFAHENFEKDMFLYNKGMVYMVAFSQEDKTNMNDAYNSAFNSTIACLLLTLPLVIFRKKIPLLNRVEKRWKIYLLNLMVVGIPYNLVSIYGTYQNQVLFASFFNSKFDKYKKYKLNGDIRELDKNIPGF